MIMVWCRSWSCRGVPTASWRRVTATQTCRCRQPAIVRRSRTPFNPPPAGGGLSVTPPPPSGGAAVGGPPPPARLGLFGAGGSPPPPSGGAAASPAASPAGGPPPPAGLGLFGGGGSPPPAPPPPPSGGSTGSPPPACASAPHPISRLFGANQMLVNMSEAPTSYVGRAPLGPAWKCCFAAYHATKKQPFGRLKVI